MKLHQIELKNFRLFERFTCAFEPDLTVLVGQNGLGKTTLLDAITIGLGQFVGGFGTGHDVGIHNDDIRLERFSTSSDADSPVTASEYMELQFPVTIESRILKETSTISCVRTRNTLKGRTTQVKELKEWAHDLQNAVQSGEHISLPLLAYYGTGRLWAQKRLTENKKPTGAIHTSRLDGYIDCMDPASSYSAFSVWFRQETIAEYEYQMAAIERKETITQTSRSRLLAAITDAVNTVLAPSGWRNLRYSAAQRNIVASHQEYGDLPVTSLSDGVRNMIGLVADIAYRAVRLNPHLLNQAVKATNGIVLIDEVDMHLHPEWQQLILQNIREAFPNLQFIVTTHSPQVLSSIARNKIRLLSHINGIGEAALPMGETLAEASNDLLERVMNVSPRPPLRQVTLFQQYMRLIDTGLHLSAEAQRLRAELISIIGADHEDMAKADRAIRRKELLG